MILRKKLLIPVLILAALLAVTAAVLSFLPGKYPGRSMLSVIINPRAPSITVSEMTFDIGRNRVFAYSDGTVAAAGTLGLQVLGHDGHEILRHSCRMSAPALGVNNGRFLAFDIGGKSAYLFDTREMLFEIETHGLIVSASLNGSGWLCIVTHEQTGGARGTAAIYNSRGQMVYEVIMGSSFIQGALLSDSSNLLAVLSISESGSMVTLYDGIDESKDYPDKVFNLGNEIFLELCYISKTRILATGTKSVCVIDTASNTPAKTIYSFDGKRLGNYTHSDSFMALHLYDYNIGYSATVVSINFDGDVLGAFDCDYEIFSMSSFDSTLMLLNSDGVEFYSKLLEAYPAPEDGNAGAIAGRVFALGSDTALAANDLSAVVVRSGS